MHSALVSVLDINGCTLCLEVSHRPFRVDPGGDGEACSTFRYTDGRRECYPLSEPLADVRLRIDHARAGAGLPPLQDAAPWRGTCASGLRLT